MEIAIGGRGSRDASCPRGREGNSVPRQPQGAALTKKRFREAFLKGPSGPRPAACNWPIADLLRVPFPYRELHYSVGQSGHLPGPLFLRPHRSPTTTTPRHIVRGQVSNGAYLSEALEVLEKSPGATDVCAPRAPHSLFSARPHLLRLYRACPSWRLAGGAAA